MAWLGGVGRIFVCVGSQQVQIDLKWQRGEGHGMPIDLDNATELITNSSGRGVRFLKIVPLVVAKFQSYGRGKGGDYTDLLFVCTDGRYSSAVRQAAESIDLGKREDFIEEVHQRDHIHQQAVRYALRLEERSPCLER